ncbi:syntaxin-8 isoform X1 [Cuculus canorus]|uniref:syntaxin-8 isoform X1 n=1 Tax=Cuculus canorus TaxID=55661 RepID=UPI0023AADA2D|nr:syntaxin-8 isoform X1 [Cuculus canorus]
MAPDPWLSLYDTTSQLAQEIAEKIRERHRHERNGESAAKLNVIIRSSLQNLGEKINQLKELLLRAVSTHQITQLEGDRRQNLVDDLLTRQKQLQASYRNEGPEPDVIRSSLMTGGVKRGVTNPWLLEESEETRGLGFDDLRQQQRRIIEEQDAGLDALSSIISRQKQMGREIGNELDEQNEIIDDLTNLVENTDDKLRNQTRHVKMVDKKSTSCGRNASGDCVAADCHCRGRCLAEALMWIRVLSVLLLGMELLERSRLGAKNLCVLNKPHSTRMKLCPTDICSAVSAQLKSAA